MEFIHRYRRRLETLVLNDRAFFFSGSASEIPAAYFLATPTDLDLMIYKTNVCAVPKNLRPPDDFRGEVLTIDPQGLSLGYVRLKKSNFDSRGSSKDEEDYQENLEKFFYEDVNGPALTKNIGWSAFTFDYVFSVQCPYWPPEAEEWPRRHRPHGWPSKDLVDQIVSEGCFLVGKSHPNCQRDDNTQWRYSFSKAEVRLISSWTDSQKYVYNVLRLIKSDIVKKSDDKTKPGLCTYHFKTQMLWACEEKPVEFWEEDNLIACICELLTDIEKRFTVRHFPNYFLRGCNIIDGKCSIEEDCREAMRMFNAELGQNHLKFKLPPKLCHQCRISISFPFRMALHHHLFSDRLDTKFQEPLPRIKCIQELIDKELDDLMNGIYNMQLAQAAGDSHYVVAEKHFWNSIACADSESESSEVKRIKLSFCTSQNAVTAMYESFKNPELSALWKEENSWDFSMVTICTKHQCPNAGRYLDFSWNEANGKFHEKWMNPFHVISAAYLSNLYFMTGNYEMCYKICQEGQIRAEEAASCYLFPMIFCPELAPLFDENIQAVLGLIWLYIQLRGGERNFEFCTCPQLFLRYICIQSSLRLGDTNSIDSSVSSFDIRRILCRFPFHPNSYHYFLLEMAWRICVRR